MAQPNVDTSPSLPPEMASRKKSGFSTHLDFYHIESFASSEAGHWLLGHGAFQATINGAILISAVEMGVYAGHEGRREDGFLVLEHLFTSLFLVEMGLKLWILRREYFTCPEDGPWNALDFFVAWLSVIDAWILVFFLPEGSAISIVRVFRLLRLLRLLKLAHKVPELTMVIEGIVASLKSMVWILLLLIVVLYVGSIICAEIIGTRRDYAPREEQDSFGADSMIHSFENHLYFGSVSRSLVSLFGVVLLAEWSDVVRPVFESQPWMIFGFVILVVIATFGIFNVIVGVIVERTTGAMNRAKEVSAATIRQNRLHLASKIADAIFDIDTDGDAVITRSELESASCNMQLKEILSGIQLPLGFQLGDFHEMLDTAGKGHLTKCEFTLGMLRLIEGDEFSWQCLQQLFIGQLKYKVNDLQLELRRDVVAELAALRQEHSAIWSLIVKGGLAPCPSGEASASPKPEQHFEDEDCLERCLPQEVVPLKAEALSRSVSSLSRSRQHLMGAVSELAAAGRLEAGMAKYRSSGFKLPDSALPEEAELAAALGMLDASGRLDEMMADLMTLAREAESELAPFQSRADVTAANTKSRAAPSSELPASSLALKKRSVRDVTDDTVAVRLGFDSVGTPHKSLSLPPSTRSKIAGDVGSPHVGSPHGAPAKAADEHGMPQPQHAPLRWQPSVPMAAADEHTMPQAPPQALPAQVRSPATAVAVATVPVKQPFLARGPGL